MVERWEASWASTGKIAYSPLDAFWAMSRNRMNSVNGPVFCGEGKSRGRRVRRVGYGFPPFSFQPFSKARITVRSGIARCLRRAPAEDLD
jgi:hypothetical protein